MLLVVAGVALADTGAITGTVEDGTNTPLVGVTVVVTAPSLPEPQITITDEHGAYTIAELSPGSYLVTFVFLDKTAERAGVEVKAGARTAVFQHLGTAPATPIVVAEPREVMTCNGGMTWGNDNVACGRDSPLVFAPARPRPQVQADLGLAVIGAAYEQPVGDHYAVQLEAQAFSTYFAPWFSAGDRVDGFGGQVRPTWFRRVDHHGLYVAPWLRVDRVTHDIAAGVGFAAGAFAGYAFAAGPLDVRVGGGAQYMRYFAGPFGLSTPFIALDLVVGYRL